MKSMEQFSEKRIVYLDMIRVVACFFVIVTHVSGSQLNVFSPQSFDFQVSFALNACAITAPAVFFMLSGAIFLNPHSSKKSIKEIWSKCILRMVISYVFYSFLYTFIIWYPYYTFSFETLKAFLAEFFTGVPMYHMWFIPAIISIYMVLPLFRPALTDKKLCKYYLALFIVIQLLIPTILKFDFPKKIMLESIYKRVPCILGAGYMGYYVLGYYLSIEEFSKKKRLIIYAAGMIALAIAVIVGCCFSLSQNTVVLILNDIFTVNCFLFASAFFVAFRYIPWKTGKFARFVSKLSGLTFGIYLLHPLFMNLICENCGFLMKMPAMIYIPLIAALTFLCCAVIVWVISKIPIANKYLI